MPRASLSIYAVSSFAKSLLILSRRIRSRNVGILPLWGELVNHVLGGINIAVEYLEQRKRFLKRARIYARREMRVTLPTENQLLEPIP